MSGNSLTSVLEDDVETPKGDMLKNFDLYNDRVLRQAIDEAGIWTPNCVMVELWVWNGETSHLHLKGSWLDPILHKEYCSGSDCPMCMLRDPSHDDYLPELPVAPGEGLPGLLWSSGIFDRHHHHWFWSPRPRTRYDVSSSHHTSISLSSNATSVTSATAVPRRHLQWRELQAIAHDPHQPFNSRLLTIANIPDANYVTAVPFQGQDVYGMVIYVCRGESMAFATEQNEHYILSASQLIGSTFALRRPWLTVVKEKRSEIKHTLDRLKSHFGVYCLESIVSNDEEDETDDSVNWKQVSLCRLVLSDMGQRVGQAMTKAKGAGMRPPPAMSWNESFLTFVGVFWTLLILTKTNHGMVSWFGSEYEIVLGYVERKRGGNESIISHLCTVLLVPLSRYCIACRLHLPLNRGTPSWAKPFHSCFQF